MGKRKWSISVWKSISEVSSQTNRTNGYNGYNFAECQYNATYHTSVKMTPFQALYSYEPPIWNEIIQGSTRLPIVKDQLEDHQRIMQTLKYNLTMAHNLMKQQAEQHRTEREFELAD